MPPTIRFKRLCRGAGWWSRLGKVKVSLVLSTPPPALRTPRTAVRPSAGRGLGGGQRASECARAADAPGQDPAARMTARGAAGRCPPTTWLGLRLLLLCLLVSGSITKEELKHCSHMIGDGHLQLLQQLIDSQMETSCLIEFEFVDQEQLKDPVCYLKKAFLLVQDIMEASMRFRDNTSNANATMKLRELAVRLQDCFPTDYEEEDKACVRIFHETPLQFLEKIKNVFNETKNLLKKDPNIFSKNCNNSFAKCSKPDVVTNPDCNCLYPKATPSSDLASDSPQQPLGPSIAPVAGLTEADSEGTEDSSLLPSEQHLRTVDLGSAKQRPPRSTCQSLESPETPGIEGSPTGESPQPRFSVSAPTSGMEDIPDSVLGTNGALEEASGEAGEGPVPRGAELSSSRPGEGSIQAKTTRPSDRFSATSPLFRLAKGLQPAYVTGTSLPKVGPMRPTGQAWSHALEKTARPPALPRDHQEPASARAPSLHLRGLNGPSTLSTQPRLPNSHFWGNMLPLGEMEGKRSTRDRRSTAELKGGRASEGAARSPADFNPIPLTDAGPPQLSRTPSPVPLSLQPRGLVSHLVSVILVLLAVGSLLFYRWRRRSHQGPQTVDFPMEQPEGSPLTQDEDRQVELPV